MQKRYQTQDIVKLVLKRTANCRFGGLPEKRLMCRLGDFESNPLTLGGVLKKNKKSNFFERVKKGANFRKMIFMRI